MHERKKVIYLKIIYQAKLYTIMQTSYWHKPPAANNAKQELIKVTILVALLRAREAKGYRCY